MKYLRLIGYIIASKILIDFTASYWNWFADSAVLPRLGLLLGIPLGYCVWKRQEKSRRVDAFIKAELQEYRQKICQQKVEPGQIIFLRRSDGAFVTEWTTGWATIIERPNGFELSIYAKDSQGREMYGDTKPGELTVPPRLFQSQEAACEHLANGWFAMNIYQPGSLEVHWPGNIARRRRKAATQDSAARSKVGGY